MKPETILGRVTSGMQTLQDTYHIFPDTVFYPPYDTDLLVPTNDLNQEVGTYFRALDQTVRMLPELTKARGVIKAVEALREPPHSPQYTCGCISKMGQYVLMLQLSMLAHAAFRELLGYKTVRDLYEDDSVKSLWPQLALPLWELSERTGIDPTMAYWLYGLNNKRVKNPTLPKTPDNFEPFYTFTGSETEKWFLAVHHGAEVLLAQANNCLLKAYFLSRYKHEALLTNLVTHLNNAAVYSTQAVDVLKRMRERLDPFAYFQEVRMFYAFPRNVIFVGVEKLAGIPQNFEGETGGGSAAHHLIDAIFGIRHRKSSRAYIRARRRQMPAHVRELLKKIERSSRLRSLVLEHPDNTELTVSHNANIDARLNWRLEHRGLIRESISQYGDTRGTANPALTLMDGMIEDTRACLIH